VEANQGKQRERRAKEKKEGRIKIIKMLLLKYILV